MASVSCGCIWRNSRLCSIRFCISNVSMPMIVAVTEQYVQWKEERGEENLCSTWAIAQVEHKFSSPLSSFRFPVPCLEYRGKSTDVELATMMRERMDMNIDEQFESFLADLGVEMERPTDRQYNGDSIPEISIFQSSRDHYGVFYRLDIINGLPELRIMVPVDKGEAK